jgi:L-alanine-DL-glutamate epimerase-like enolase superfamily enzyme
MGEDPFRREWLWHRVWELDRIEEFPLYVLGPVDVALHDLAGKALAVPVHELLGGFRTEIPAYASTVTFSL